MSVQPLNQLVPKQFYRAIFVGRTRLIPSQEKHLNGPL
jgi:hypothetical protein